MLLGLYRTGTGAVRPGGRGRKFPAYWKLVQNAPPMSSEETPPLHFRLRPNIPLKLRSFLLSPPRKRGGGPAFLCLAREKRNGPCTVQREKRTPLLQAVRQLNISRPQILFYGDAAGVLTELGISFARGVVCAGVLEVPDTPLLLLPAAAPLVLPGMLARGLDGGWVVLPHSLSPRPVRKPSWNAWRATYSTVFSRA